jgi:hypothetical protein
MGNDQGLRPGADEGAHEHCPLGGSQGPVSGSDPGPVSTCGPVTTSVISTTQAGGHELPYGTVGGSGGLNSLLSVNIRGLLLSKDRNKPAQLSDKMSNIGALGAVITESWLSPSILDAEVSIDGYHLYRTDRSGRSRGGVCAYIREDLATIPSLQWSNGAVEVLVLKARSLGSLIAGVYRPPDTTTEEWTEAINILEESISLAQANSHHFD